MEHVVAMMLIVGCSGDLNVCEQKAVHSPIYASVEDCQSQIPLQMRLSDATDSKLFGTCATVPEDLMARTGEVDWSVTRAGHLAVHTDAEPQRIASR